MKIAIFGLLQIEAESGLPSAHPYTLDGLRFEDPMKTAGAMKSLRRGNEVLIALTHLGYDQDRRLAGTMPELDVIIGGHSHTRVDPAELVNGVLVAQTGSDNRFLGRVELTIRGGRVVNKSGRLIDLRGKLETVPDVEAMIDGFYFIQLLRLRHQHDLNGDDAGANRVNPDDLNELDRHILKEAFKQARKLQDKLRLDYRL